MRLPYQALMYGIPILAVLIVLPSGQITSLHGMIDAMKTVYTVYGGDVSGSEVTLTGAGAVLGTLSAVVFIWVLIASGSAWIMGAGRAQAAACLDGAGPPVLGRISERSGVPVVMGLVSGGVSLLLLILSLWVTGGDNQKYFSVALNVAISLIVLAYLFIYPAFLMLRLRHRDLDRPFRVPGGAVGAWLLTILAIAWSLWRRLSVVAAFRDHSPGRACPPASRANESSTSCSRSRRSWQSSLPLRRTRLRDQ